MTARGWFVTGTDTGVGKTRASCALLHALRGCHVRCVGMKPVAAGAEPDVGGQLQNEDVLALRAASSFRVPPALDNPVLLPDADLAPHRRGARGAGDRRRAARHRLPGDCRPGRRGGGGGRGRLHGAALEPSHRRRPRRGAGPAGDPGGWPAAWLSEPLRC